MHTISLKTFAFCVVAAFLTAPAQSQVLGNPLTQLIEQTLANHPSLQNQEQLVKAAQAGVDAARWQYFPTPAISVQQAAARSTDTSYLGDARVSTLSLTQPIWTWGRLSAGMDKAQAQAIAATAGYQETQLQLAIRVLQSYGDWLSAHHKLVAFKKGVELHERLKAQANRRMEAGQAAPIDLAFAQGRLATMVAEMAATQAQAQIGLVRLTQLSGQTLVPDVLATNAPKSFPLAALPEELLAQADAASPMLARYRAQAQIQFAAIQEQKASALPEVSFRLEQQYGNFSYVGSQPQTRGFVGISSNFGAGLSRQAALAEVINRHAAALADVQAQRRTLGEQILTDHALLVQAGTRSQALQQAAELAEQVLASSDRQYLTGRKTWQDLMNSAREQVQAQLQLVDLEVLQLVASWRLALLTSGLANTLMQGQPKASP